MKLENLEVELENDRHIVSVVGAGGKTSLLVQMADDFTRHGKKVLVTTTTRMYLPDKAFATSLKEVEELFQAGSYAVLGSPCGSEKMMGVKASLLQHAMHRSDIVLIEADGSRHYPVKLPGAHEPVILPETDTVIAVSSIRCLKKPGREVCFRWEELLKEDASILTPECLADILSSTAGSKKAVGDRDYIVFLNQCETNEEKEAAKEVETHLLQKGSSKVIIGNLPVRSF